MSYLENIDYLICPICKQKLKRITNFGHLRKHKITMKEFKETFPNQICELKKSLETRKKQSESGKIAQNNPEVKEKLRLKRIGRIVRQETRKKTSLSNIGKHNFNHSRESIKKIRIKRIEQIQKNNGIIPNYNKEAIEVFKCFDEQNNTQGRYAVYGNGEFYIKELGYFLDYFNDDLKIIIEWNEKHHYSEDGTLREKDLIRQNEIQKIFPNFKFYNFNEEEANKVLKEGVK